MDLIPITKIKIKKEKWFQQKIKYEEDLTINGVLERSCHIIYNWVNNLEDYSLICKESFYEKLKTILYENYFYNIPLNVAINDEEDYDYFELKHLEEINSLFLKCKELFDYYGVDLFQRKTDNLMNLFYFIYNSLDNFEYLSDNSDGEEYLS
tara:strand:- start:10 stop:465 length:456 start_codon:yes stop_codon:yes gene_type:complete